MGRAQLRWLFSVLLGLSVSATETVAPPDVYQAVRALQSDIEAIRFVMGRHPVADRGWVIYAAEPRHVYYQAQTLFRRANQLAQELAQASRKRARPTPNNTIEPHHVLALVADTAKQIEAVKASLSVHVTPASAARDPTKQPKDVLRLIAQTSHELSVLLDQQYKPQDSYRRVVMSLAYVMGLARPNRGNEPPPTGPIPTHVAGKMPSDVYAELLECMRITESIAESKGLKALQFEAGSRTGAISPADVYDIATLLMSELTYLSWHLNTLPIPFGGLEEPDHVFPSHVFQVAQLAHEQLSILSVSQQIEAGE